MSISQLDFHLVIASESWGMHVMRTVIYIYLLRHCNLFEASSQNQNWIARQAQYITIESKLHTVFPV